MIELIASALIATSASVGTIAPLHSSAPAQRPPLTAASRATAGTIASGGAAPTRVIQNGSNDSVKNGALIGLVTGGLLGMVGGALGCGVGTDFMQSFPDESEDSCTGPAIVGALVGGGLGALMGAGVDAMFDQAPGTGMDGRGRRKGIRLTWRF